MRGQARPTQGGEEGHTWLDQREGERAIWLDQKEDRTREGAEHGWEGGVRMRY